MFNGLALLIFVGVLALGSIFIVYIWLIRRRPYPRSPVLLTPRQLEVVSLVASGKTNKVIAQTLAITEGTVKNHVSNMYLKLNLPPSRVILAEWYRNRR